MVSLHKYLRNPIPPNSENTIYTIALVVAALVLMAFVLCVGTMGVNIPPSAPPFVP